MSDSLFVDHVELAVAASVILYGSDLLLTLGLVHFFRAGASRSVTIEGRPAFLALFGQNELARPRALAAALGRLGLLTISIPAAWALLAREASHPEVFSFLMGGLVLLGAVGCAQDLRDITVFRRAGRARTAPGKIVHSEKAVYAQTGAELQWAALLWTVLFLATAHWFYLGGAVTCFVSGRRRRDWSMIS